MTVPSRRRLRALGFSLSRLSSSAAICAVLTSLGGSAVGATFSWDPAGDQSDSGGAGTWDLTSLFWNDNDSAPNVAWPNLVDSVASFGGVGGAVLIDTGIGGTGVSANGLIFTVDGYSISSDEPSELINLVGASPTINVTTGTATITSVLSGSSGFTKTGTGTLTLGASNSGLIGPLTVNGGTLNISDDNNLGNAANGVVLDGGAIDYTGGAQWDPAASRVITIGAGGGTIRSSIAIRITDPGQITGSGTLTREASGTSFGLDLQRANVGFTGNTVINSGVIEFRDNAALGIAGGQTVTINGGRMVVATGPGTGNFAPTLSHPVTLNGGAISFGNQIGGVYAGNVNVTGASGIIVNDFYQNANRGGSITGVLSGSGRLDVSGVTGGFVGGTPSIGSVLLTNPTNSYSGTISIGGGAHVRAIQGGGVDALASATIELNGGGLGLAPVATTAGANSGLFGRYYNSPKINNGVGGGFDWGTEQVALARNDATIDYPSTAPIGFGVSPVNMGVLWTGMLEVTNGGTYAFSFRSDDGSMIYVDGQQIVANDFSQGANERFGSISLAPGFHPIIIKYAQGGGGAAAQAFYNGPDTGSVKALIGSVAGSVTNNGAALFAPTTMNNNIDVFTSGDIDLAGANATSTGTMTFSPDASLRVTGVTGFETLTHSGAVVLNGNNTIGAGITLTNNQTNTHGHNSAGADIIISSNITQASPGSGITKVGPRTLTLTGTNAFTGPVIVQEGRLVGNTASLTTPITTNSIVEFNQVSNGVFGNVIDGNGSLVKSGAGILSLNGSNTYTGLTLVNEGTLTGTGSLASTVIVSSEGTIAGASGGTFTVGGVVLKPESTAAFALGAPSVAPLITDTGSVGGKLANFVVTNAGAMAAGTYRLIDYSGAPLTNIQLAGLANVSGPAGFFYGLVNNSVDTSIDLTVETVGALNTWTGATSGVWDTGAANWSAGNYADGQRVVFSDGPTNRNISGGAVAPQGITVSASAGNDYVIGNSIVGTLAAGFVKSGTGSVRLIGANTFTGSIEIQGGILRADVSSTASGLGLGAVSIGNGATLQLDPIADTSTNGVSSRYLTTSVSTANGPTVTDAINFDQSVSFGANVVLQTDTNLDPAAYNDTNAPAGGAVGYDESTTNVNWKSFAIERTAKINIATEGWYSFFTGSDDGSKIFINGSLVANSDGGHGVVDGIGTVYLKPGLHDFRYEFAQGAGGADERIQWAGPGIGRATIPASVMFTAESASVAGASNDVVIGTPVSTSGNATIALGGSQFTGVRIGALLTDGGTLNVTGEEGKSLRSATTILNGSITINNVPTLALGKVDDGGTAITLTKAGSGTLIFDNVGSGLDASTLSQGTVLDVQAGVVKAIGSSVAGATNPLGLAKIRLNGGTLALETVVGTATWSNEVEVQDSSRLAFQAIGVTTNFNGGVSIAAGETLTLDLAGGGRGSGGGYGGQASTTTALFNGVIAGAGNLLIDSTQTNGGQSSAAGSLILAVNPTYTGLTTVKGFSHSQPVLELRGLATLQNTSGINTVGKLALTNSRLNLQNNNGGNLSDRVPDAWPVELNFGTVRFDGANGTSSNETIGPITLIGGQNNLFGGTVSGTAFHTLTSPSITRLNRSTLRLDANNLGSLSSTNGVRFVFTDSSGFNEIGGGGTTATNASIIPWVWGAPTGNNRTLATYDANGLRLLADAEYTTLAASTDVTNNIRESVNNNTVGSGAAQAINSLVAVNTQTGDRTLTLAAGTVLNVTSGTVLLGTTDGTARRVTLTGGEINFGSAEGVLIGSRREHQIQTKLSGTNGLTITGDGQVTLNQATNDFSGLITVTGGDSPATDSAQLNVVNDGSLGNVENDVLLDGSGFRFGGAFTTNAGRAFTLSATGGTLDTGGGNGTVAGQVTGAGSLVKAGGNTLTLANETNNYAGETHLLNGGMVTNTGPQGDIHHFSSGGALTFSQSFDGTYAGDIDGVGSVAKAGTGIVTFTGDHTYAGTTTVNDGTLLVNGTIAGSTTTVNAGTLGGSGSIAFDLVVGNNTGTADALLSPGASIGTLAVGGNVTLNSDAAFTLEINTTSVTTDLLASEGVISLGLGVVPLNTSDLGSANLTNSQVFTFLTAIGGITGEFAGLPDGAFLMIGNTGFNIDYQATSVSLVAVPEPGSIASVLGGLAVLAGFSRRRRRF